MLSQYTNDLNNITYTTYQLENGVQILHLLNPTTVDTNISLIFKAGSIYEQQEKVPTGTAHYLEHMLLNPNEIFKTREDIDQFEMGSRTKPAIYNNAHTTKKHLYIDIHGNHQGEERMLERLKSTLTFPKEIFSEQMEKEREIILAERARRPKEDKDPYTQSLRFLLKETPEFQSNVLGEEKDIKSINIDDLERYFKARITQSNMVISIQSKNKLNRDTETKLLEITNTLPKGKENNFREYELKNKYDIEIFEDDRAEGTLISIIHFNKAETNLDYERHMLDNTIYNLLNYLGFKILREEKHLVYEFTSLLSFSEAIKNQLSGVKFVVSNNNIKETLNQYYNLMTKDIFEFLDSDKGVEWLEDHLSSLIFPRTQKFDYSLAERNATQILEFGQIPNDNDYRECVKGIKINKLKEYIKEVIDIPPHIWIETDKDKDDILEEIEESNIAKRFKD